MVLDLSRLMPDNKALTQLNMLAFDDIMMPGKLDQVFDIVTGVRNGDRYGEVKEFGEMTQTAQSCNPEYNAVSTPVKEYVWNIAAFGIYVKICADDIIGTILRYCRNKGIATSDLTADDFQMNVLLPMFEEAIMKDLWRSFFFNKLNISVYSSSNTSGELIAGKQARNYNWCDGAFAQIEKAVANGTLSKVSIAANSQATYALQKSALYGGTGAAIDVLNNMLVEAPNELIGSSDVMFLTTRSIAQAVKIDMKKKYNTDMSWDAMLGGMQVSEFDGVKLVSFPLWDEIIQKSFVNTSHANAAWLNPHRAILCSKSALKFGSENNGGMAAGETGNSLAGNFAEFKVWYEEKEEQVYGKTKDTGGVMLYRPKDLIVAAY